MPKLLNWITDPDDVMAAMVLMEGDDWGEWQDTRATVMGSGQSTLPHAIAALSSSETPSDYFETVYGDGGGHRYFLRGDGRVDFSKGHACPVFTDKVIQNATDLGFHIF